MSQNVSVSLALLKFQNAWKPLEPGKYLLKINRMLYKMKPLETKKKNK